MGWAWAQEEKEREKGYRDMATAYIIPTDASGTGYRNNNNNNNNPRRLGSD